MTRVVWVCEVVVLLLGMALGAGEKTGVHMADGIKIGEVRQESAIVWTRLTRNAERNVHGLAFTEERTVVPTGRTLNDMEGGVPGMDGKCGELHGDLDDSARQRWTHLISPL